MIIYDTRVFWAKTYVPEPGLFNCLVPDDYFPLKSF